MRKIGVLVLLLIFFSFGVVAPGDDSCQVEWTGYVYSEEKQDCKTLTQTACENPFDFEDIVSCREHYAFEISECVDTDGGEEYYVKGETKGRSKSYVNHQYVVKTDYCVSGGASDGKLVEYYCEDGFVKDMEIQTIYCEHGCKDGACLKDGEDVEAKCYDDEGKVDLYEKGSVTVGDKKYYDHCKPEKGPEYIVEKFCKGDYMKYETLKCSEGEVCNDGECIKKKVREKEYCGDDYGRIEGDEIMCNTMYEPVCGSDGKEYGNSCGACRDGGVDYYFEGKCEVDTCTDTDGGRNYYKKGKAVDLENDYTDHCNDGSNYLTEKYCEGGKIKAEKYKCENGCYDGACKKDGKTICGDGICEDSERKDGCPSCVYSDPPCSAPCYERCEKDCGKKDDWKKEKKKCDPDMAIADLNGGDWACPELWSPVCGIDGEHYDNACFACMMSGFDYYYEGECDEKDIKDQKLVGLNGCSIEGKQYDYGFRKNGKYCSDLNGTFVPQKDGEVVCENNFECKSNLCVDGVCVSQGLLRKIFAWLAGFFS